MFYLYILKCSDGSLYAGIATDPERRLFEHNHSAVGAKYTRSRRPVKLVFCQRFGNRSRAARAEALVKSLPRIEKLRIIRKKEKIKLK